ncbi:MAG: hypothetical protein PHG71_09880, partial [Kiritimatiellae bacterium]|nr:hypothetical protein [Kiritimatiellia bacterium]
MKRVLGLIVTILALQGMVTAASAAAEGDRAKHRDDPAKYWNLEGLSVVPSFRECPIPETRYEKLKPILVSGKGPDGTNAEFFAYYAVPEG